MTNIRRWLLLSALALGAACSAPGGPGSDQDWPTPANPNDDDASASFDAPAAIADAGPAVAAACVPARSSEPLPPLTAAIVPDPDSSQAPTPVEPAPTTTTQQSPVFVTDLYTKFRTLCGACHGSTKASGTTFSVDLLGFKAWYMDKAKQSDTLARLASNDPANAMPQGTIAQDRGPNSAVNELARLLGLWFKAGTPGDVFFDDSMTVMTPPATPALDAGATMTVKPSYTVPVTLSTQLSNIGSCIPNKPMIARAVSDMDALDASFASFKTLSDLPDNLAGTDLISFDSEILAERGVIGFAPTYPLWSDDAYKMRAVRVPRGKSIVFNKTTQMFDIPPNTRFYKTFLRKIIDQTGKESYRKIETRLIVSRPDVLQPDGKYKPAALFATYIWNADETEAVRKNPDYRDGTPFADLLLEYSTNEQKEKQIRDSKPKDLDRALRINNPGLIRTYAVPGRERCIECHMGPENHSFILGFTPLQLNRRSNSEGGTYDDHDAGPDEVNQLQRFIDYGLITGMSSPDDVKKLEDSQGDRKPRAGGYELKAQGYLVGNCSHCHNPNGFPSQNSPDLVDKLDFLPSAAQDGGKHGIFQFDLETVSPLRTRGRDGDMQIPYITPSLRDLPYATERTPVDGSYIPKFLVCEADPDGKASDVGFCGIRDTMQTVFLDAPWRSLIYRNVDTPFMYVEDYVLFPHMPRNTPGYDCRAARILADWMVSIPSKEKKPTDPDQVYDTDGPVKAAGSTAQPYAEVKPGDPEYDKAVADANDRLKQYRQGKRYSYCPDTNDIVDPAVATNPDGPFLRSDINLYSISPTGQQEFIYPADGVPNHAHWVVTDLTEPPGPWTPRRTDWKTALITSKPETIAAGVDVLTGVDVPVQLQAVKPADLKDFALGEVPMAKWVDNPKCSYPRQSLRSDYGPAGKEPRNWFQNVDLSPNDHIYSLSRGGAVFNEICIKCHGANADSKGLLAGPVAEISGGIARVADFRDGLFGGSAPGEAIQRVFGPFAQANPAGGTADEWAARYMAFMALGGTSAPIPPPVLGLVGAADVFGTHRTHAIPTRDANMLQVARVLCQAITGAQEDSQISSRIFLNNILRWPGVLDANQNLIDTNGDSQLWQDLCSFGNRQLVRVLTFHLDSANKPLQVLIDPRTLRWADSYPTDQPVLNHHDLIEKGIQVSNSGLPANLFPMCYDPSSGPGSANFDTAQIEAALRAGPFPLPDVLPPPCPPAWLADAKQQLEFTPSPAPGTPDELTDVNRWAARGAMNAGMSVFYFLEDMLTKGKTPLPANNHCEDLQ